MEAAIPLNKAMVKEKYLAMMHKLRLVPGQVRVGAGSALVMYGLRDVTSDIDADTNVETAKLVSRRTRIPIQVKGLAEGYMADNTLLIPLPDYDMDLHGMDTYSEEGEMVDGVFCYTLEMILAQKLHLNRPKDQQDIINIRAAIKARK